MIATVLFAIGFFIAWKLSLRATVRGAALLALALVLFGIFMWSSQMHLDQDVDLTYVPPNDNTGLGPTGTVLVGFMTGAAAVSFAAYGLGALLGRLVLKFKKNDI